MSHDNTITAFIESLPEDERQRARDAFSSVFLAMLQAQDIARERAKDPVGWAIKRLDFTGAPFPIELHKAQFHEPEVAPCILTWWPRGKSGYYVDDPVRIVSEVFSNEELVKYSSVARRFVEPEERRYGFTFSARVAFEEPDQAAHLLAATIVDHQTGFRPRVKSEKSTYEDREAKP